MPQGTTVESLISLLQTWRTDGIIDGDELHDLLVTIKNIFEANDTDTLSLTWDSGTTYDTPATGAGSGNPSYSEYGERFWKSKTDSNLNNEPPSDSETTENTYWIEVSKSNALFTEWTAGLYGAGLVIVFHNDQFWKLGVAERPYESEDINAEITAGDWMPVGTDPSTVYTKDEVDEMFLPPIADTYADTAAMIADQGSQSASYVYKVTSPSIAYYEYLGTTVGDITDYDNITSEATAPPNKSSKEQAEAGTNNTNFMTALRVVQLLLGNYQLKKVDGGWQFLDDNDAVSVQINEDGSMSFDGSVLASINFDGTSGNNFMALKQNQADALSIISGVLKFLQFDTTTGNEKVRSFQNFQIEKGLVLSELDAEPDAPASGFITIYAYSGAIKAINSSSQKATLSGTFS